MTKIQTGSQAVARIAGPPPAVFEILDPKHIEVTSLTFRGHVTLSVR